MNVSAVTASAVYLPMQALAPSVPGEPIALNLAKAPEPVTTPKVAPVAATGKESSASRSLTGSPRQEGGPVSPHHTTARQPLTAGRGLEKVDVYA